MTSKIKLGRYAWKSSEQESSSRSFAHKKRRLVDEWKAHEVSAWLLSCQQEGKIQLLGRDDFTMLANRIEEYEIDGKALCAMDDTHWKELGASNPISCLKLNLAVQELKESQHSTAASSPEGRASSAVVKGGATPLSAKPNWKRYVAESSKSMSFGEKMLPSDHRREWHESILYSGRPTYQIREAFKSHNDNYILIYLLMLATVMPVGFSEISPDDIEWEDGNISGSRPWLSLTYLILLLVTSMHLFLSILLCVPANACIDACSDANLVVFFSGPGLDMLSGVSTVAMHNFMLFSVFVGMTAHIHLGEDPAWWAVVVVYVVPSVQFSAFLTMLSQSSIEGWHFGVQRHLLSLLHLTAKILLDSGCAGQKPVDLDVNDLPSEDVYDGLSKIALERGSQDSAGARHFDVDQGRASPPIGHQKQSNLSGVPPQNVVPSHELRVQAGGILS